MIADKQPKALAVTLITLIGAAMGSGGGVYVYMQNVGPQQLQAMARPDPATGSELNRIEIDLRRHLHNHPDVTNQFNARLIELEVNQSIIISNQNRILEKLVK